MEDNKQALNTLYQAAAQARLTKEEHDLVQKAAQALLAVIEPKKEEKKK